MRLERAPRPIPNQREPISMGSVNANGSGENKENYSIRVAGENLLIKKKNKYIKRSHIYMKFIFKIISQYIDYIIYPRCLT